MKNIWSRQFYCKSPRPTSRCRENNDLQVSGLYDADLQILRNSTFHRRSLYLQDQYLEIISYRRIGCISTSGSYRVKSYMKIAKL